MYWSGCQSTGAEMRKYFTVRLGSAFECGISAAVRPPTVIHLLKSNLSIVRQSLLCLGAQHERLRLLRRHGGVL